MKDSSYGPLITIRRKPVVGVKYHVSWGTSKGVVGVCVEVLKDTQEAILMSPKTNILWKRPVKWSDMQYIRRNQPRT